MLVLRRFLPPMHTSTQKNNITEQLLQSMFAEIFATNPDDANLYGMVEERLKVFQEVSMPHENLREQEDLSDVDTDNVCIYYYKMHFTCYVACHFVWCYQLLVVFIIFYKDEENILGEFADGKVELDSVLCFDEKSVATEGLQCCSLCTRPGLLFTHPLFDGIGVCFDCTRFHMWSLESVDAVQKGEQCYFCGINDNTLTKVG